MPVQVLDPCLGEVSDGELAAFCELAGACLQHDGWRRPRMTEAGALLGQICALHAGGLHAGCAACSRLDSDDSGGCLVDEQACRCMTWCPCGIEVQLSGLIGLLCLAGEIAAEQPHRPPATPRQGPQVARPASRVTPTSSNEVRPGAAPQQVNPVQATPSSAKDSRHLLQLPTSFCCIVAGTKWPWPRKCDGRRAAWRPRSVPLAVA